MPSSIPLVEIGFLRSYILKKREMERMMMTRKNIFLFEEIT